MAGLDYVDALRRHGERMAEAAEGRLDRAVPACPGWTVADLVSHMGRVHRFWRHIASGVASGPGDVPRPDPPSGAELVPWLRAGTAQLAEVLDALPPDTAAWTWWPARQDVGFIQRRMAHETAVHCWDALAAAGEEEALPAGLAVDGVDEFLDQVLPRRGRTGGAGEVVHLHALDAPGEWVVRVGDDGIEVERSHARGDAAVQATASDLLLLLWRRRAADDVTVHGDRAALDRFLARTDLN